MVTTKPKMSASYKAVFALSIIMIFVGMLGGAGSGSKGAGGGAVFVWGYTVWLMYKRDNKGLVSLYRLFLWWQGIAVAIVVAFSIFDASFLSMSGFARFSVTGLLILGAVLMSISYGLLTYFRHQLLKPYAGEGAAIVDIEILDKFWEQASLELQNSKNEAVWAKAFANSEGDDAKTRAMYIKLRARSFQKESHALSDDATSIKPIQENIVIIKLRALWNYLTPVGVISLAGILCFVLYSGYSKLSKNLASNDPYLNERKTTDFASVPLVKPSTELEEFKFRARLEAEQEAQTPVQPIKPKAALHTDIENFANWIYKNEALKGTPDFETVAQAFTELDTARGAPSKPVTTEEYAAWIVKNKALKGTPDFETVAQAFREGRAKEIIAGAYYTPKSKNKERVQDNGAATALKQEAETQVQVGGYGPTNKAPSYPHMARRMGLQGKVVLNVEVLANGSCGQINVAQSSGHSALDNNALSAVKTWHFVPATKDGKAINKWHQVPIIFSLKDN